MKYVRSIAMTTDHGFHGNPVKVTRIDLYIDEDMMTPEIVEKLKRLQVERLHHSVERMPHSYWAEPNKRPYAEELK